MCNNAKDALTLEDIYFNAQLDLGIAVARLLNREHGTRLSCLRVGAKYSHAKQDGKWHIVHVINDYHVGTDKRFFTIYSDTIAKLNIPVRLELANDIEIYTLYRLMYATYEDYINAKVM